LLQRFATQVYGLGEVTALVSDKHSELLPVAGLSQEQMMKYFEKVGLRAVWQGQFFRNAEKIKQGPTAAQDLEFEECLNGYVASRVPVIVCLDSALIPTNDSIDTSHIKRDHHAIIIVGCKKWTHLQHKSIGLSPEPSFFLYHDSSVMPFTEIPCERLLRSGYVGPTHEPDTPKKYPNILAVTPKEVQIPLMDWKLEKGGQASVGLLKVSQLIEEFKLLRDKRAFLLFQLKSELRVRLLELLPTEMQDQVGDRLDEMVGETSKRFGWNGDGTHWAWFEIGYSDTDSLVFKLWDAEADPGLLSSKADVILKGVLSYNSENKSWNWNWNPIPNSALQYEQQAAANIQKPPVVPNLENAVGLQTNGCLKPVIISSFDLQNPFGLLKKTIPEAKFIQFYACMNEQLKEFFAVDYAKYGSALRIFANYERMPTAEKLAADFAKNLQNKLNGQRIIGFATYFPEIMSTEEKVADWARDAILFLVRTASYFKRDDTDFIIELAAGTRAHGLATHPKDSSGAVFSVIMNPATRYEKSIAQLLGRLDSIAQEALKRGRILLALQLEPGPIFLLNGAIQLDLLCKQIDENGSKALKKVVGLNLDIAHWAFLNNSTSESETQLSVDWLRRNPHVLSRIIHAHICDHGNGHMGDLYLEAVNAKDKFEPWLQILSERAKSKSWLQSLLIKSKLIKSRRLPYSGYIAIEHEACKNSNQLVHSYNTLTNWLLD